MSRPHTPQQRAEEKLAESGLSKKDAKTLDIATLTPVQTEALSPTFAKLPALRLWYHDLDGRRTAFYRLRYLEQPKGFGTQRWHKYTQPPGTAPQIYLPTIGGIDWLEVAANPTVPLYLTEGELKAAAGCRQQVPVIGLGGVYAWRSTRFGSGFLPALARFDWTERPVTLLFDSDTAHNPQVVRALYHLAMELLARGALPHVAQLPTLPGMAKTGLDDLLVAQGFEGFSKVVKAAEPVAAAKELWQMNSEYVFVRDPGIVVELATEFRMRAHEFIHSHAANRFYYEKNERDKLVKKPLAPAWVSWPFRYELKKIVYTPGEETVTDAGDYNTWKGWGVQPIKGDCQPWHDLLAYVFRGLAPSIRQWFERWLAYPLQHPGVKLYTSVLVWGVEQGAGKSLLGYTMGRLYGRNFREIHQTDLQNRRNTWSEGAQFILGDEVLGGDKRTDIDRLKGLITQQTVLIDQKYVPEFTIVDRTNYYFTSQHPGTFFMDDQDRRFFVLEMNQSPLSDEFYDRYDRWFRSDEGAGALFDHLLHLPLGNWNPHGRAMDTAAKRTMIDDARSDLGAWVARLHRDPAQALRLDGVALDGDLWTNEQLRQLYDPERRTRVTANGLGRELTRAGISRLGVIRTKRFGLVRVYVLRGAAKWQEASAAEATRHFNRSFPPVS